MNLTNLFNSEDRAVSPVIGVILMVAITVILAAVIGTFVLGLGDQVGDSAPQASFSSSLEDDEGNITLTIEKTGGQDIDANDLDLVFAGTNEGPADNVVAGDAWRTGEELVWSDLADPADERIQIRLVHSPTGDTVYSTTRTNPIE